MFIVIDISYDSQKKEKKITTVFHRLNRQTICGVSIIVEYHTAVKKEWSRMGSQMTG